MNELKFRIFNKINKEMISFNSILYIDLKNKQITYLARCYHIKDSQDYDDNEIFENRIDFKDCVFMNYLKMKDKKEKEIYEGDIIISDLDKYKGIKDKIIVEYDDFIYWKLECVYCSEFLEIIGNIYENKELLKEKSNLLGKE